MNNGVHNKNKGDGLKGTTKPSVPNVSSMEHQPLTSDIKKISINNNMEQRKKREGQEVGSRSSCSGMDLGCQPNNGFNSKTHNESNCPASSQGSDSVKLMNLENSGSRKLSGLDAKNLDDSTNDSSSTFMLNKELELEQKTIRNDLPSTAGRYFRLFFLLDLLVLTIFMDLLFFITCNFV